jgi:nucleotide-binding universal stress UspA family protein
VFRNILIATDGSPHAQASLDAALWLAPRVKGTLHIEHVIDLVALEGPFLHDLSGSVLVFQARAAAGDFDIWAYSFTASEPLPPPPPPPPAGAVVDCASADAAGLVPLVDRLVRRSGARPVTVTQSFASAPGKTALVCLDNGPGGARRVTDGRVWLNGDRIPARGHLGARDAHLQERHHGGGLHHSHQTHQRSVGSRRRCGQDRLRSRTRLGCRCTDATNRHEQHPGCGARTVPWVSSDSITCKPPTGDE